MSSFIMSYLFQCKTILFFVGVALNKNVDIKFSVHCTFLESASSGTFKVERLEICEGGRIFFQLAMTNLHTNLY